MTIPVDTDGLYAEHDTDVSRHGGVSSFDDDFDGLVDRIDPEAM